MKEFLEPHPNGNYAFVKSESSLHPSWLEIPDGSECAVLGNGGNIYFWKSHCFIGGIHKEWVDMKFGHDAKWYLKSSSGSKIIWQRSETEYLMQGKNGERLMESVGQLNSGNIVSAFVVDGEEKHSHYRKSVKHLDFIDPYRIAQLYDLHPCADHIAKKALCTGKRGHKDLMRDIQDIIDTAERWKQMIQEDQNAI